MKKAILAIFLASACLPALAVGKVTVDPNTPGAAAKPDGDIDTRLAQKVTISETIKPVREILADLSKLTGITFKAGYNNGDWQVRDRKMCIFAQDVPLAELMSSISRVMKFKWSLSGEGDATVYRLYMDRRTLLDAEAQRVRIEEKAAEEYAAKRANALAQYGKGDGLTAAEMEKLKTDNPIMYIIAQSGMGASVASFFREVPAAAEAVASGRRLEMNASGLSPSAWESLVKSARAELGLEARFGRRPTEDALGDLDQSEVRVVINADAQRASADVPFLLGDLTLRFHGQNFEAPIIDPESKLAKMIGEIALQSEQDGCNPDDLLNKRKAEFATLMTKETTVKVGGEAVNEHPDDPALDKTVKLEPRLPRLQDVEQSLAEESKFAVVSDSFSANNLPMIPDFARSPRAAKAEKTIKEVLTDIEESYAYNWDKHGGVIELWDRNWFRKRAAQVPDAWLENWRNEMTKTGTLSIDNLAQIAQLTQEQIDANIVHDSVLSHCSSVVQINREMLRLWNALSSSQRTAMLTESGLDLAILSADQWAQAENTLKAKLGSSMPGGDQSIAICCSRKPLENRYDYRFTLRTDGPDPVVIAEFGTPPYYAPEAPKPSGRPAGDADTSAPAK